MVAKGIESFTVTSAHALKNLNSCERTLNKISKVAHAQTLVLIITIKSPQLGMEIVNWMLMFNVQSHMSNIEEQDEDNPNMSVNHSSSRSLVKRMGFSMYQEYTRYTLSNSPSQECQQYIKKGYEEIAQKRLLAVTADYVLYCPTVRILMCHNSGQSMEKFMQFNALMH